MKDTVRIPRPTKPATQDTAPLSRPAKPGGKDTVRLDRPPAKGRPAEGTQLEDYLKQQKPHVDPPAAS